MKRSLKFLRFALALVLLAALSPGLGNAAIHTLTDLNSIVRIDDASSAGANTWLVDGQDQLFQQWFWYRVGSTGPESPINTLGAPAVTTGGLTNYLRLLYTGTGFTVDVQYLLAGGTAGSRTSDLAETIRIINTSSAALDFHFFQYCDFDLNNTIGLDTVNITGGNTAHLIGDSPNNYVITETVVTGSPNHVEAGIYPNTLNRLNDGDPTTLNGVTSAYGDATWAFQWDRTIAPNGTFIISKDKHISGVPLPPSVLLLGSGLLGLVGLGWKRRKTS